MGLSVAIVGSGPSGFYTADALLRGDPSVTIDIIERLPAPFGLIRYGVAPDHQTTKNVQRAFDRTARSEQVRYFGNIEVGRDISVEKLRELYDAVVFAVGSPFDRPLGIPGEDKKGVVGSAAFVGWYNGHPDFCDLDPPLDTAAAVVIGNGNVAIDVARVLVKTREEMAESDITDYAIEAIQASPLTDVYMVGRRGPIEAKFTNVELREMGHLQNCVPVIDGSILPADTSGVEMSDRDRRLREKNLGTLREFAVRKPDELPKRCHFVFFAAPVEILGGERVEAVRFERTEVTADGRARGTGELFEIECGLVVPAIGYRAAQLDGVPYDERNQVFANEDGRIADGLYAVGWVKRGPTGVIGTNKPDGKEAAERILAECHDGKPGRAGLEQHIAGNGARLIDYDDWLRIEAAEKSGARAPSPRRKMVTVAEVLKFLDG